MWAVKGDVLREATWIEVMLVRKGRSRQYTPWLQHLAIVGRRVVETVRRMLRGLFPWRIHAVTQEGFVLKILSFVLAHDIRLIVQKVVWIATWVIVTNEYRACRIQKQ